MIRPLQGTPAAALRWAWVVGPAWIVLVFVLSARGPLLHEDYVHLVSAQGWAGPGEALDPGRVPLRPFQHLAFYAWAQLTPLDPLTMRLPALVLHGLSCVLVHRLAGELGARARGRTVALLLFAAFPNLINVLTPAAIGSSGYVAFSLAALVLFVRGDREDSRSTSFGGLACTVLALGFHQAAVLVPAVFGIWILVTSESRGAFFRRLRRPATLAGLALMVGYVVYFQFFRPDAFHRGNPLDALPATTAKALTSFLPELVRTGILDGLRGRAGPVGAGLAATACLSLVAFLVLLVTRGSPATRFCALAVALLLALPAAVSGFVLRYAYLASALAACGAGVALERAAPSRACRIGAALLAALGLWWAVDTAHDAREYAAIGAIAERLVEQAAAERARLGPQAPIAVVDLPDRLGAERDIPFFALGFREALELRGAHGRWLLWRTASSWSTTDHEPKTEQQIEDAVRSGRVVVLRYDPQRRELARTDG